MSLKKDFGYFLLELLAGVGVLLSALLPVLILEGPWMVFIAVVIGAGTLLLRKIIVHYTGADETLTDSKSTNGTS